MITSSPLRHYVTPLVDWARDGPESSERIRAVLHPAGALWPWLRGVIAPCYWRSLDQPRGLTLPQFIDECRERVFIWAKEHVAEMSRPEFSDKNLKAVLRTIAHNLRTDVWREIKRHRWERLDDYFENPQHETHEQRSVPRRLPKELTVPPEEFELHRYLALADDFNLACRVMPRFHRSLRKMKKMRAVLAYLLRLGRKKGRLERVPAHWFVWRLLRKKKKTQLPRYIRAYLRARLPEVRYEVINARLGYLRRALTYFLRKE